MQRSVHQSKGTEKGQGEVSLKGLLEWPFVQGHRYILNKRASMKKCVCDVAVLLGRNYLLVSVCPALGI